MIKKVPVAQLIPIMQEVFKSDSEFRLITAGTSMMPMLRDRKDFVVLVKPKFPMKKYDVILYKRKDGTFVLHRIIGKNKKGYILCGDNQYTAEKYIQNEQIIAVMKAYIKDGIRIENTDLSYRRYCFFHCKLRPIKRFLYRLKRWIKRKFSKR